MTKEQKAKWGNTLPQLGDWLTSDLGWRPFMFQYDTDPYLELLDNFHPIPLTPGVLEKIKEVYIYEYGTRGRRGKIEVNDGDNELRFDLMTKERKAHEGNCPEIIPVVLGVVLIPQITHLHHLQQLYRILSGKELTIDWT